MKVVFIAYNFLPQYKSPAAWLQRISPFAGVMEALAKKAEVFYFARIGFNGEYVKGGVTCRFIKPGGTAYFPRQLHKAVKKINPDIVIIPGFHFPLQVIQLRKMLGEKVRIIAEHHADRPSRGIGKSFQKRADKDIDKYHFSSLGNATPWIETGIIADPSKCFEIAVGSTSFKKKDKSTARKKLSLGNGIIFLSVGRLNANKDPLTLIRGMGKYLRSNMESMLYMVYQEGEMLDEIRSLVQQHPHLKDSVVLQGYVPHDELENWYNAADFYVSASLSEGGSIALLEAMACGCIPVVTSIPAAITVTGAQGIHFKPGDYVDLEKKLDEIHEDSIPGLSDAVVERFNKFYSFNAIADRLLHSFE